MHCRGHEQKTEERQHVQGSKPQVDFLIISQAEDVLYLVPIETKKQKDMAQLAQHMSPVGQQISNTCVGYLLDEDSLQQKVLLPIAPALNWCHNTSLDSSVWLSVSSARPLHEVIHNFCGDHKGLLWRQCKGHNRSRE